MSRTAPAPDRPSARRFEQVSAPSLALRQVVGMIAYTVRESLHRWTLVAFFLSVTFFLLLLATTISLDVVEGTLASARLFGQELELGEMGIRITDVVSTFQLIIVSTLYTIGIVLALFSTSNVIPRLCEPGWVDLLLAQPVSRSTLLLGRALGAITVVTFNLGYLIVGSWLLLRWKTGMGSSGYLIAGLMILVAFAGSYAAVVLAGVITRSSAVSALIGLAVWISGHVLYALHRFPSWSLSIGSGWQRETAEAIAEGLYWLLPKNQGLGNAATAAARGDPVDWMPVVGTLPFIAVTLALACWWFARRDN